jgi:hypothetical protein
MSSTRAALRRNESKATTPASAASAGRRSGSIPSIRGANTFNPNQNQQQQLAIRNNNQNQMQQRQPPQPQRQLTQQQQRLSQQQMNQQQQQRSGQQPPQQNQQNHQQQTKSQMTIDQAITLITLRLGRLEVFMNDIEQNGLGKEDQDGDENRGGGGMDEDLAQNILTRLDTLEENDGNTNPRIENGGNNSYADKTEVTMLKQQVDALKKLVTSSTKTTNAANTTSSRLKSEMEELRKSLLTVEQIAIENNTQLMLININKESEDVENDEQDEAEEDEEDEEDADENGATAYDATAFDQGNGESDAFNGTTALDNAVYVEDEPDDQDIDE